MSYPTGQSYNMARLRVRVRGLRPHVPSPPTTYFPRHRNFTGCAYFAVQIDCFLAASGHVDSYRRAPRMVPTCRLQKAAVLFFRGWSSMRSRQCTHRGRSQTFSDGHDQQRHVASASRLCQGRSRLRARRGRVADRDQRRALSRFRLGRRGERARSCHPHLVAALQEQATKLWHMSNLFKSPDGDKLAARLCEQALPIWCSSVIPARKRWSARSRSRAAITPPRAIPSAIASSPSRAPSTAARWARWRRPAAKYLEGFGPPLDGFDQVPHGDLER